MQDLCCKYCLNKYTLENKPLMIKCTHCLCKRCMIYLNENYQNKCFWCGKDVSYSPECLRVHQITYNKLLIKNQKLCRTHAMVFTHISKITLVEYCERCLQEGNINFDEIEDIINKENVTQNYIEKKTQMINKLIEAYEENINAINRLEEFYKKIDNAKKIHEALISGIQQETLIDKIALIKNFDLFKFQEGTELEDKLAILDKQKTESAYLLAVSSVGISREKRLINWNNDNGVWLGNTLYRNEVLNDRVFLEFTFQGNSPLKITSVGLGMSYSQESFLYYYQIRFREVGGIKKDFLLEKNVDKVDNRITTEFSLGDEGYTLNPRRKYNIETVYEGLNFYSVLVDSGILFHQMPIFKFEPNFQMSMILYMKFK
ncbi:hypothetical protein SteCoe_32359 [Stentor coeruleus]|uniref:RING-type domain-containing protein n=1 Tax=Stentor coeruleus TaxID=5963 RepID=A0A1R2AZ69_9CILI|nr:hypothetical protein SteCoe_32359 [Stentor coeruleus]